jgi:acyl dehydratase
MNIKLEVADVGVAVAEAVYAPVGREDLQRYAYASGDLNPLHLDPDFARQAGFDDVIVHGMLAMALLGRLLEEAFPKNPLKLFRSRFRNIIPLGQPIKCTARLEQRAGDSVVLALTAAIGVSETLVIEGSATLGLRPAQ